jgi:hypothetical protein
MLGLLFIAAGFIVMYKAWDGAANRNVITGQFPYVLSGGFIGMGLVVTGGILLLLATVRAERQILTDKFDEMSLLLTRNLNRLAIASSPNGSSESSEQVIAGSSVYHRPGCKILEGKKNLTALSVEQASAEGLAPCRACDPPVLDKPEDEKPGSTTPEAQTPVTEKAEVKASGRKKRVAKKATTGASETPTP